MKIFTPCGLPRMLTILLKCYNSTCMFFSISCRRDPGDIGSGSRPCTHRRGQTDRTDPIILIQDRTAVVDLSECFAVFEMNCVDLCRYGRSDVCKEML